MQSSPAGAKTVNQKQQTTVIRPNKPPTSRNKNPSKTINCKQVSSSISCLAVLLTISHLLQPISVQTAVAHKLRASISRQAQDVALDGTQTAPDPSRASRESNSAASKEERRRTGNSKVESLNEFLAELPTLSVGQKHSARFECELDAELHSSKLIWLRLSRSNELNNGTDEASVQNATPDGQLELQNDIKLISLNERLITPDKRFKVRRQSALKWTLTIDNVGPGDNRAYYLCQISGVEEKQANQQTVRSVIRFAGGARLNVLMPPKIVEQETSDSLVQVDEFDQLVLRCKVLSEPQSQLMWKREDGRSLDGLEQRFKHEIKRTQTNQIMSIDSSELVISSVSRNLSGAYLCIASNGVQPGVSQRVNVGLLSCRHLSSRLPEPCESPHLAADDDSASANDSRAGGRASGTTSSSRSPASAAAEGQQQQQQQQQPQQQQQHQQQQRRRQQLQQQAALDKRRMALAKGQARMANGGRSGEEVSIKQSSLADSAAANSASRQPCLPSGWISYLASLFAALAVAVVVIMSSRSLAS